MRRNYQQQRVTRLDQAGAGVYSLCVPAFQGRVRIRAGRHDCMSRTVP